MRRLYVLGYLFLALLVFPERLVAEEKRQSQGAGGPFYPNKSTPIQLKAAEVEHLEHLTFRERIMCVDFQRVETTARGELMALTEERKGFLTALEEKYHINPADYEMDWENGQLVPRSTLLAFPSAWYQDVPSERGLDAAPLPRETVLSPEFLQEVSRTCSRWSAGSLPLSQEGSTVGFGGQVSVRRADRYPSIQAAHDDLPVTGGVIVVPAGVYTGGLIITKSNVTVLLDQGATVLKSHERRYAVVIQGAVSRPVALGTPISADQNTFELPRGGVKSLGLEEGDWGYVEDEETARHAMVFRVKSIVGDAVRIHGRFDGPFETGRRTVVRKMMPVRNVRIVGGRIDANGGTDPDDSGVYIRNAVNVVVNTHVTGFYFAGILVSLSSGVIVTGTVVGPPPEVSAVDAIGVDFAAGTRMSVAQNMVLRRVRFGAAAVNGASRNRFVRLEVTLVGNGRGVKFVQYANRNAVLDSSFYGSGYTGAFIVCASSYNVVEGNRFIRTGNEGVIISDSGCPVLGTSRNTVRSNYLYAPGGRTGTPGIEVWSDENIIDGNVVVASAGPGIRVRGLGNVVVKNRVIGASGDGVLLLDSGAPGNVLLSNMAVENRGYGFHIPTPSLVERFGDLTGEENASGLVHRRPSSWRTDR